VLEQARDIVSSITPGSGTAESRSAA
jgi:hypothetical protein